MTTVQIKNTQSVDWQIVPSTIRPLIEDMQWMRVQTTQGVCTEHVVYLDLSVQPGENRYIYLAAPTDGSYTGLKRWAETPQPCKVFTGDDQIHVMTHALLFGLLAAAEEVKANIT